MSKLKRIAIHSNHLASGWNKTNLDERRVAVVPCSCVAVDKNTHLLQVVLLHVLESLQTQQLTRWICQHYITITGNFCTDPSK